MASNGYTEVYIVRSNIPKILYDMPHMKLMQRTCSKLEKTAIELANKHTKKHGYTLNRPYVSYVIHGDYTPIGIVRTRTKNGARDNIRHQTLKAVIDRCSLGGVYDD